jgi:hypothetical protein
VYDSEHALSRQASDEAIRRPEFLATSAGAKFARSQNQGKYIWLQLQDKERRKCHSCWQRVVVILKHLFAHRTVEGYISYFTKAKCKPVQWRAFLHCTCTKQQKRKQNE